MKAQLCHFWTGIWKKNKILTSIYKYIYIPISFFSHTLSATRRGLCRYRRRGIYDRAFHQTLSSTVLHRALYSFHSKTHISRIDISQPIYICWVSVQYVLYWLYCWPLSLMCCIGLGSRDWPPFSIDGGGYMPCWRDKSGSKKDLSRSCQRMGIIIRD